MSQKGFTLVESLLVLSIFMIISSITVFTLQPQHTKLDDDAFLTQLQADLFYAQQYAISHQQDVSVYFFPSQYKYRIIGKADHPPLLERYYSTNFYLKEGSMTLYFKFLSSGNVNKFGTFFAQTKEKSYRITVLIGKGRFYVTEQ